MTAPKRAATRPAALTGRVGQGGDNRVHDVALVQALLGQKRDRKSNRPYLRGHVTGKYDKFTAEALMRFRMDQRDGNMRQPLTRIARRAAEREGADHLERRQFAVWRRYHP